MVALRQTYHYPHAMSLERGQELWISRRPATASNAFRGQVIVRKLAADNGRARRLRCDSLVSVGPSLPAIGFRKGPDYSCRNLA